MADYTPTTKQVREGWWTLMLEGAFSDEEKADANWDEDRRLAQFDRWLNGELAKAWDEGYMAKEDYDLEYLSYGLDAQGQGNPYRKGSDV